MWTSVGRTSLTGTVMPVILVGSLIHWINTYYDDLAESRVGPVSILSCRWDTFVTIITIHLLFVSAIF